MRSQTMRSFLCGIGVGVVDVSSDDDCDLRTGVMRVTKHLKWNLFVA